MDRYSRDVNPNHLIDSFMWKLKIKTFSVYLIKIFVFKIVNRFNKPIFF